MHYRILNTQAVQGRVVPRYRLKGLPGVHADAAYVWSRWKKAWRINEERDVTQEVLALITHAAALQGRVSNASH